MENTIIFTRCINYCRSKIEFGTKLSTSNKFIYSNLKHKLQSKFSKTEINRTKIRLDARKTRFHSEYLLKDYLHKFRGSNQDRVSRYVVVALRCLLKWRRLLRLLQHRFYVPYIPGRRSRREGWVIFLWHKKT